MTRDARRATVVLFCHRTLFSGGEIIDGKYKVVRLIGEGGMGAVYEGQNLRLDRTVAIKVMHASLTTDRDLVARFEREAQAAARMDSAHIVDVLDLGDLPNGDRFMVMEFLKGESLLERLVEHGRLPVAEVGHIGVQLLAGLTHVHRAGILHRDLKPANVFLTRDVEGSELVKILDFGACKMKTAKVRGENTAVGHLLGTLPYMAPETLEQGSAIVDARSDLYSVGVLLYRSVSGQLPYVAANLYDLMKKLREGRAAHVCDIAPDVDAKLGAVIDRAIEWDPKARFQDAREFQRALLDWGRENERITSLITDFLDPDAFAEPTARRTVSGAPRAMPVAAPSGPPAAAAPALAEPQPFRDTLEDMMAPPVTEPPAVTTKDESTRRYGAEADGPLLDYLGTAAVASQRDTERSIRVAPPRIKNRRGGQPSESTIRIGSGAPGEERAPDTLRNGDVSADEKTKP